MNKFEVGKVYKFNMDMKEEFINAHSTNENIFEELSNQGYIIYVRDIEDDLVKYCSRYALLTSEIKFFTEVPIKSEADIVKEWFDKLKWLDDNTPIAAFGGFVTNEVDEMNDVSNCIDFVINSYNSYKQKAAEANKQKLQSEKEQLLARLSEIDKELGK